MWADADYVQQSQNADRMGIVPFPTAQFPANPWLLYSYAMSSSARSSEESWLWLHFVSQNHGEAQDTVNLFYIVPTRRSAAEANDYWVAWDRETAEAIRGAMEYAWSVRLDAATTALEGAIDDILAGKPVRTALDEAQIAAMRGQ